MIDKFRKIEKWHLPKEAEVNLKFDIRLAKFVQFDRYRVNCQGLIN